MCSDADDAEAEMHIISRSGAGRGFGRPPQKDVLAPAQHPPRTEFL